MLDKHKERSFKSVVKLNHVHGNQCKFQKWIHRCKKIFSSSSAVSWISTIFQFGNCKALLKIQSTKVSISGQSWVSIQLLVLPPSCQRKKGERKKAISVDIPLCIWLKACIMMEIWMILTVLFLITSYRTASNLLSFCWFSSPVY